MNSLKIVTERGSSSSQHVVRRLLGEPLLHFFVLGALLFVAHRVVAGEPSTIAITSGVRAELARRFEDRNGKKPSPAELETELRNWKRDEAIFREAMRERLDRDDPGVRVAMIEKMRARAALEVEKRDPTPAELEAWFLSHRSTYETPLRYDFEFVAFPKSAPDAAAAREHFATAVAAGASPTTLGTPIIGGNLSVVDMQGRVEPELILQMPELPRGEWRPLETGKSWVLARVKGVTGGVPELERIRANVIADWSLDFRQRGVDRALDRLLARYHFEERR